MLEHSQFVYLRFDSVVIGLHRLSRRSPMTRFDQVAVFRLVSGIGPQAPYFEIRLRLLLLRRNDSAPLW